MQKFFTVLTLTFLMLTFFVWDAAHADWNGDVDVAKLNESTAKRKADTQYDVVRNAASLYSTAKSEYEENEAKIERGTTVTAAKLLAATVSVYVSGTLSAPVAVSTLVEMLDLSEAIQDSTSLLSAYETAISSKFNEIEEFEILSIAYTNTYDIYIGVLAGHTGWTESYLSTYIENEYNRSQGIKHKGSITPSNKHGIVGEKEWGPYDKSLPSYPCEGTCTESFMMPTSDHEIICGGPEDPSTSQVGGCWVKYYSCDTVNAAVHTPGPCVTQKWYQAWNRGPNGESVSAWVLRDCGDFTRMCFHHTGGHASPAEPGNNNLSMLHTLEAAEEPETPTPESTPVAETDLSPDCDSCTTGGCSSCPITGACGHTYSPSEANSHALQASCSISNNWMRTCTATNFYACQGHTCVFPTFQCGRASCTQAVADPNEHRRTCINGHNYWSCNTSPLNGVEYHKTRTCTRRKVLYRKWIRHLGIYKGISGVCNESWANCDRRSCMDVYRAVRDHEEGTETPVIPE
ncbi:MAG: hypothetical protein OXI43_16935 [Candidatus Poribacteria bacterium]|nr:hypothetical protein [Candidatus Poribacteria bacterium]